MWDYEHAEFRKLIVHMSENLLPVCLKLWRVCATKFSDPKVKALE